MNSNLEQKARTLADLLLKANLRLATGESCTGGWISQLLTSIPGSSEWFEGAVVSYSNAMKHKFLGVPEEVIRHSGAVSQSVVESMALGVVKNLNVPLSVTVSGVAGPGGGSPEKPVGTVWIGWCFDNQVRSKLFLFSGDREQVREQTVAAALDGLIKVVQTIAR
ncbi:damage-inducible protein CinA [Endozoicomonas sp. OPT23]|uniref:CinA family protein n=1 Tax=Endozoicomonas sp. OPT23 TaxID=2072845 RepID=UPI00129B2E4E|nr:CinA family protein [Endozoicomonas sp. OPT23]MRI34922.1 damage-inducible protein CinA [Endozoicomonas sp. OPT23]